MAAKSIPLTKGYSALVDPEDYERVAEFKWTAMVHTGKNYTRVYAYRKGPNKGPNIYLHNFVLGVRGRVDHHDHDGLNNQRYNLRPSTQSQNCANSRKRPASSVYKGVAWDRGKWYAYIKKDGVESSECAHDQGRTSAVA